MLRSLALGCVLASACAAAGGGGGDPMKIEVPPQPPPVAPQPATTPPPPPPAIAARPFACKDGHLFQATSGRDLCAHTEPMSWDDAEARCVTDGGHLLAFEKPDDVAHAERLLGSSVYRVDARPGRAAWIGLEIADRRARAWRWSDGEPVKRASWAAGEPNNWDGNERCGEWLFATGKWNDTRCNLEQPYLCEGVTACATVRVVADKDYCWVPTEASFANAKKGCAKLGGRLALPKTAAAQSALTKGAAQRFPVTELWIGLNELAEPGTWLWTTGALLGTAFWKPMEPNGYRGSEHCVEAFTDSWEWNDLDCSEKLPFVCQSPAKSR